MAEQGRPSGRAEAWRPWSRAARGPAPAWLDHLADVAQPIAQRIREAALAEAAPGRLVPWLAVAFGCGVMIYFAAEREPAWWATITLFAATATVAFMTRRRRIAFPLLTFLAVASAGLAAITLKREMIAHPVLSVPAWNVEVAGFVEARQERERSDRIVVRVERISGPRLNEPLERVRVSVRKGTAPAVGSFVTFKARLTPPLEPLRPGGYDFARELYFQRIGASGFVLGRIAIAEPPRAANLRLRFATAIDGMREAIDKRIRSVIPGDRGAIASALITGKRDAITAPVNEAMYVSSLAHVLSISGYHMALVAGIVFFVLRALFALMPAFAGHYPIKKWAAVVALAAAAFYLALSGAEVATQRSFIMVAVVLVGVMIDRPTITLRTLTVAALGVLLIAPESIVHPSFQMSFAATLALVAGYQQSLLWTGAGAETPLGARIAVWGGREIAGLALVSLLAGTATMPYVAYHFHRLAPYGVLANLLAMPVISLWVMPLGIVGLAALPFGLDGSLWWLMGEGIGWMISVAVWVTGLPGAVGRMPAFGIGPLLLCSAGLVVLCLLRTWFRLVGALLIGCALLWAMRMPQPDVLIAPEVSAIAIRGADGRLAMVKTGSNTFAFREWLAADADARAPNDKTLTGKIRCDDAGCIAKLADGALVAIARSAEAFEEDCRRAALVVTGRDAPPGCAALVVDRQVSRRFGAMALRRIGSGFEITPARPGGYDRPWALATAQPRDAGEASRSGSGRQPPRDATPREDDLEAGD